MFQNWDQFLNLIQKLTADRPLCSYSWASTKNGCKPSIVETWGVHMIDEVDGMMPLEPQSAMVYVLIHFYVLELTLTL